MRRWDYYLKDMLIEPIGLGAFKKSLALLELGIPVAEPVAAVTIKGPLFKKDSILINREISNNFTLLKLFSDDNLQYINNDQII